MDTVTFVWTLINICCCSIVTTGIVYDLIVYSMLRDDERQDHMNRTIKAFFPFSLLEIISTIVLTTLVDWNALPLIFHITALFMSCFAFYNQYQLVDGIGAKEFEDKLRQSNILRAGLWVCRFISLFLYMVFNN